MVAADFPSGTVELFKNFRVPIPSQQFHESSQAKGLFKRPVHQGRMGFGARSVHGVRVREGKDQRTPLADFFNRPHQLRVNGSLGDKPPALKVIEAKHPINH